MLFGLNLLFLLPLTTIVATPFEGLNFIKRGNKITGVLAKDLLTQKDFEIKGKFIVNAAGPWAETLLGKDLNIALKPKSTFSRDACFVVRRKLSEKYGLAVITKSKDPDALLSRKGRHLFIAPWRDYTLVGVWHVVHKGKPGEFAVTPDELTKFTSEVNAAYPGFNLKAEEVSLWNAGLILFGENEDGTENLSFGKESRIIDHAVEHDIEGLISLIGVSFTTARREAENTLKLIGKKLKKKLPASLTANTAIYGGEIASFSDYLKKNFANLPPEITEKSMRGLLHNHGSEHKNVLPLCDDDPLLKKKVPHSPVLQAEVVNAMRNEMGIKLTDVLLRRTDLGMGEYPGSNALATCLSFMPKELQWDGKRKETELQEAKSFFSRRCLSMKEQIEMGN